MNSEISPLRVVIKAVCLFAIINIVYALVNPQGITVSGYNVVFPGRTRLPFGVASDPYSVTVEDVDVLFASHAISAPKAPHEYRIALLGDSSLWGEDLGADEVISEHWNRMEIQCGDATIKAYNLGYPHPSLLKDLVILDKAVEYKPDLVIWFVTLNTLMSQRINPFLVTNRERVEKVLTTYDIAFQQAEKFQTDITFYEKTLIGQRSNLARQIKLQMLGIIWTATRADTNTLAPNQPTNFNFSDDPRYRGMQPPQEIKDMLLFDAIQAGHALSDPIPVLVVNEPIFIAPKANEMVRYNIIYPRWAYDQYREALAVLAQSSGWNYLDLWKAVPPEYFSDAGLHLSSAGERLLVQQINPVVQSMACNTSP